MFNKAIILGRAGQDAEKKVLPGGTEVTNFSLATSKNWKDKEGEWQQKTQWHNCVVWSQYIDVSDKIKKGALVLVEGKIEYQSWKDKEGKDREKTIIVVDKARAIKDAPGNTTKNNIEFKKDDLPF